MDLGLHIAVHARKKSFLRHSARLSPIWIVTDLDHRHRSVSSNANVAEASITGSQGLTLNNSCVISLPTPIAAGNADRQSDLRFQM
jgi:hypothetical protein